VENKILRKLNLSRMSISCDMSPLILKCSSLTHLNLSDCFDFYVQNFENFQNLKYQIYEALMEVDNLNEFIFQGNKLFSDDFKAILELLKKKINLHNFDIQYCNEIIY
jgi:hypothetical protein